ARPSPQVLLYRRRYYQYMTPFLDWVDMIRYHLRTNPTISITGFYERLIDIGGVDVDDLRYFGRSMLECVELRKLTKANCKEKQLRGLYAGRRVYKDRDARCPAIFADAFKQHQGVIRPVLPHACSPLRRFLVHLNYYDRDNMRSLAQVLALVDSMLKMEFFTMHPICSCTDIWQEPLVFQIYDFVYSMRQGTGNAMVYLRNQPWEEISSSEDSLAWYQRWDVFNCICLLFSIAQNAIQCDQDESTIERIVHQLIEVLCCSKFLESFVAYSYFDVYLGLTSAVNSVPNISLSVLMRVLRTTPFHLAANSTVICILGTFSDRFWRNTVKDSHGRIVSESDKSPRSMEEISQFLINRSRRCCVQKVPVPDTIDSKSGMSAMGSTGAVTVFQRDYALMPFLAPMDEASIVANDHLHLKRRLIEEKRHITEYRQVETDYRYGQFFSESYYLATGRPRMFLDETLSYQECQAISMRPYKPK
uniref:ANK_REP_REGION domain-containing protein n=2 Tax=Macrostomum lignano TaxID=282301 RepID=A0A1I8GT41_9PLAT